MKFLSFLALIGISYVSASTNFTIALDKCKGDTDVIDLDRITVTCGEGSEYCTFGDTATVVGEFTIYSDLSSSMAEVKTKLFGYKKKYDDEVDICNFVTGSLNDAVCPGEGTYSFETTVDLPEEAKKRWWSRFVKKTYGKKEVKLDFDDIADVKCKFKTYGDKEMKKKKKKGKKKKDDDDDDEYDGMASAAAVMLVGAAAAFGISKRRRIVTGSGALLDDDAAGATSSSTNFEMMAKDNGAQVC